MQLASVADSSTGWNYYYSVPVVLPSLVDTGYFQVIYSTNNPAVKKTNFYSCADVALF